MFYKSLAFFSCITLASAHFQLQYPAPRGPFVEDDEPNFCDGYNTAVSNRTSFPLGNGFITLNSEHPQWTVAVLISIEQNPTNFTVFNTSTSGVQLPLAVPFFQASGEGPACIGIDIEKLGIKGVADGTNVTIQVEFDGGDGQLFQCADLTLASNATAPSNVNCTNLVSNSTGSNSSGTSTSTTPSPTNSQGSGNGAAIIQWSSGAGLIGFMTALGLSII